MVNFFMFIFYSGTVGVDLGSLNLSFILLQLALYLGEPLIGWATDVTNTRWGRRRPWMVIGTPILMLCFVGSWMPPESLSSGQAAVWFGATYCLQTLSYYGAITPYQAFGIEMTLDYDERSSLFGWAQTAYYLGMTISAGLPELLLHFYPHNGRAVFAYLALAVAIFSVLSMWLLCALVGERSECASAPKHTPLIPGLNRSILRNPPFLRLLITISLFNSQPYMSNLLPYWTNSALNLSHIKSTVLLVSYQASSTIFAPLWALLAQRVGKKRAYIIDSIVGMGTLGLLVLPDEHMSFWVGLVCIALVGATGVSQNVNNPLFVGCLADTVEYDVLRTGVRREGQFANIVQLFNAITSVCSVTIPLGILQLLGYDNNSGPQSSKVQWGLRLLIGPVAAGWVLLGTAVLLLYPITPAMYAQIRDGVSRHERGEPATDPITGRTIEAPRTRRRKRRQLIRSALAVSASGSASVNADRVSLLGTSREDDDDGDIAIDHSHHHHHHSTGTAVDETSRLLSNKDRAKGEGDGGDDRLAWFLDNFLPFELRAVRNGTMSMVTVVLLWIGALLAVFSGSLWAFIHYYPKKYEGTSYATLLAAAGIFYQLARLAPAVRLTRAKLPVELIDAHLNDPL